LDRNVGETEVDQTDADQTDANPGTDYKDEGIDGLKEKQRSGRPSKARNQNHTKLLQSILAMQNNKNFI
jgi:hypothetical protein